MGFLLFCTVQLISSHRGIVIDGAGEGGQGGRDLAWKVGLSVVSLGGSPRRETSHPEGQATKLQGLLERHQDRAEGMMTA